MNVRIRPYQDGDGPALVAILRSNGQYGYPEVEGEAAMARVARCMAAVFLVADEDGTPIGFVRGVYDGSRALIHLLSVLEFSQRRGVGTRLVEAAIAEFKRRGAPTVSVSATEASQGFWTRQGFERVPVFLMLREKICPPESD